MVPIISIFPASPPLTWPPALCILNQHNRKVVVFADMWWGGALGEVLAHHDAAAEDEVVLLHFCWCLHESDTPPRI
jgi:hypothetical protein